MKRNLSLAQAFFKDGEFELTSSEAGWLFEFGLRRGSLVSVEGADGRWFRGRVLGCEPGLVRLKIFEEMARSPESSLELSLLQAVPSRERMELIIEKAVELGVDIIQPIFSERSYKLSDFAQPKWRRWQERALRAAVQCRRGMVPGVLEPRPLRVSALSFRDVGLKLVFYEGECEHGLLEVLEGHRGVSSCALVSGPEGGFSEGEIDWLKGEGFIPVSLGGRILRAETSAIVGTGLVQFYLGDLGGGRSKVGESSA